MDPLLRQLQSLSIGASVNNMYAGGFLHADDIRTLAANASTLEAQISTVKRFTQDNFLKLNAAKCEIIVFKKSFIRNTEERLDVGEISFPVRSEAMCLWVSVETRFVLIMCDTRSYQESEKGFLSVWQCLCFSGKTEPHIMLFYSGDMCYTHPPLRS